MKGIENCESLLARTPLLDAPGKLERIDEGKDDFARTELSGARTQSFETRKCGIFTPGVHAPRTLGTIGECAKLVEPAFVRRVLRHEAHQLGECERVVRVEEGREAGTHHVRLAPGP